MVEPPLNRSSWAYPLCVGLSLHSVIKVDPFRERLCSKRAFRLTQINQSTSSCRVSCHGWRVWRDRAWHGLERVHSQRPSLCRSPQGKLLPIVPIVALVTKLPSRFVILKHRSTEAMGNKKREQWVISNGYSLLIVSMQVHAHGYMRASMKCFTRERYLLYALQSVMPCHLYGSTETNSGFWACVATITGKARLWRACYCPTQHYCKFVLTSAYGLPWNQRSYYGVCI